MGQFLAQIMGQNQSALGGGASSGATPQAGGATLQAGQFDMSGLMEMFQKLFSGQMQSGQPPTQGATAPTVATGTAETPPSSPMGMSGRENGIHPITRPHETVNGFSANPFTNFSAK